MAEVGPAAKANARYTYVLVAVVLATFVISSFVIAPAFFENAKTLTRTLLVQGTISTTLAAATTTVTLGTITAISNPTATLVATPFQYPQFITWGNRGVAFEGSYFTTNGTIYVTYYFEPAEANGIEDAKVFNCASAAATSSGCSVQVYSTEPMPCPNFPPTCPSPQVSNNTMTIWFPIRVSNATDVFVGNGNVSSTTTLAEPSWANCEYSLQYPAVDDDYGFCLLLNSTAFIISEPGPPPP